MPSFTFLFAGDPLTSYGYGGRKMAEALKVVDGGCVSMNLEGYEHRPEDRLCLLDPAVFFFLPEWWEKVVSPHMVGFTMFEGKGLPQERVALVNRLSDACLVPSRWCAQAFVESGVRVPVHTVPLGVDPLDWPLLDRSDRSGPYRFLWNGLFSARKAWDLVYGSFWKAFGGSDEVELVMHFRDGVPEGQSFGDGNVRAIAGYLPQADLLALMYEADCFVFPSRGEGWGLPPREAAATGLPAIATDYSGLAEDLAHWGIPLDVCKEVPVRFTGFSDEPMLYAEPCHKHLTELMRWCFDNREEAAQLGRRASRWLSTHGTWEETARGIVQVVEQFIN